MHKWSSSIFKSITTLLNKLMMDDDGAFLFNFNNLSKFREINAYNSCKLRLIEIFQYIYEL